MSKEDKIIRDLKRRNDSLLHQFDMTRMREISFSNKCDRLKEENKHLKDLQQNMDKQYEKLENNWNELKNYIQNRIYEIEPKGCGINFYCEYDSEEDYIRGMKDQSRLLTLKEDLSKMQELEQGK